MNADLSVYLVTDSADETALQTALAAARGGVTAVQLRDKSLSDATFIERGRRFKAALAPFGVPLIVNDRLAAAVAIDASGVHVGQSDVSATEARAVLGPSRLVGLSIETPAQVAEVDRDAVSYIGAGPVRATSSKPDHAPPTGFDGLAAICRAASHPVIAIGGLSLGDVGAIKASGCTGMAVVSAIALSDDPEGATRELVRAWRTA